MNKKKVLIMLFMFMLIACTGCKKNSDDLNNDFVKTGENMSVDEAKIMFNSVLNKAMPIYNIFQGGGLNAILPSGEAVITGTDADYYPVDSQLYTSIADIKAATEDVFTKKYAEENFYPWGFGDDEILSPRYKEIDGILHVNINIGGMGFSKEWDVENLSIMRENENEIFLEIPYSMFEEYEGRDIIILKKVDGKWLLDTSII